MAVNKRFWMILCTMLTFAAIIAVVPVSFAQDTTTTTTDTTITAANAATALYVACENQGVINLTGTALTGYDVYYQLFTQPNAQGTAVTNLRQVSVDGDYAVSDTSAYAAGQTLAAGGTGSARVLMAREGNSESIDFEFIANDVNDGCAAPQYAAGTATDTGSSGGTTATTGAASLGFTRNIYAPNNTVLNPNLQPEAEVVIGARPSNTFRSTTPGLIFAECDRYPLAIPGIIYDTDNVVLYWSWFTRTVEQMEQHIANAVYVVKVNTAVLPNVQRTDIQRHDGSINQWVFWTVNLGNLTPGHYEVAYDLTWTNPVNDGYDDYGPGTAFPTQSGTCNFDVLLNPNGVSIAHTGWLIPTEYPVHNIFPLGNTPADYP